MALSKSRRHLHNNHERYFAHQRFAFRYGWTCLQAAGMAFIHGLVPALFETGASSKIKKLVNQSRSKG